jgi:crossover junction endodeoxyribonuclease RusA
MQKTYRVEGRVRSLNAERSAHWTKRSAHAQEWREKFWVEGAQNRHRFTAVNITAEIVQKRPLTDCGNGMPTIKAAIDGLIDAGVLPDDSPEYVKSITMMAPRLPAPGESQALILTIKEAECAMPQ